LVVRHWKAVSRISLPDLGLTALCGLAWFCLYNLALNAATHFVDAATVAMLVNLAPVLIAVAGGLWLGEGFPPRVLIGCAVGLAGTVIIALSASGGREVRIWGVALGIGAAVAYTTGMVLQRGLLARISATHVTWGACLAGTLASLPFAPDLVKTLHLSAAGLPWLVYLGLGPTAIAFTTWAYALARVPTGVMGSVSYLVPVVTVGLAWLVLGELPAAGAIAGSALCLAGVMIATWRPGTSTP
jgi:drug/metabolite transporter (DMT)-like permease